MKASQQRLTVEGIETSRREMELLLMHAACLDKAALTARAGDLCPDGTKRVFDSFIVRRGLHEPVHRIIGYREFHGLKLSLNPQTLEPRDDTECLVETALKFVENHAAGLRFLDLGTGTGAVALALLSELPATVAVATDISEDALKMASDNARANGFEDRFRPVLSDWFDSIDAECKKFDFIVSNPPYIASADMDDLQAEVRLFDPVMALDGGKDGLDAYRVILSESAACLQAGGFLALETGYNQQIPVTQIARNHGWKVLDCGHDMSGHERSLVFRRARD